jgi:hypothetical protein
MFSVLLIAAKPAKQAEELAPITVPTDGVLYPLPPIMLGSIPQGNYTETEASPALQYARTTKKLAEAQKLEQSAASKQLHNQWQEQLRKNGPDSLDTQRAYAQFLAQYTNDLGKAVRVYDEVGHALEGLEASGEESSDLDDEKELAGDLEEMVRAEDVERSYNDAACIVDPESCIPPDADNQRILGEISSLISTLDTGGPTGELRPQVLAKKAQLLKRRAQLVMLLARRAAQSLALKVASPNDGKGKVPSLMTPVMSSRSSSSNSKKYQPSDPYRD